MSLALPPCQDRQNRKLNFANRRWHRHADGLEHFAAYALCLVAPTAGEHLFPDFPVFAHPGAKNIGHGSDNNRNSRSQKTVQGESGPFQLEIPRDRGTFKPQFIKKRQRRLEEFDDSLYTHWLAPGLFDPV